MSLVAWYPLNGNTNDYSGNGYHLTGTPTYTSNGKIGQAVDINRNWGSSTGFTDSICAGDFSVAFWIKIPYSATYTVSQPIGTNTSRSMNLFVYPSLYDFHGSQTEGWVDYGFFTTDTWIHVTVVFNKKNGIAYRYKNGTLFASSASTTNSVGNTFQIGNPTYYSSDVELNDIRFYDHALSEKEIKEIAKAKILHYTFDDFQEPTNNLYVCPKSNSEFNVIGNGIFTVESYSINEVIYKYDYTQNLTWTYHGMSFPVTSGVKYTYSCDVYISANSNATGNIWVFNIEGNLPASAYYNANNKGTWQTLTGTVTASGTGNATFFLYPSTSTIFATTGYVLYRNPRVEQKTYSTPFINGSRSGIVNDQSGFRNNATLALATTPQWVSDSKIGSGTYKFNNKEKSNLFNLIKTNNTLFIPQQFTISAWIKGSTSDQPIQNIYPFGWANLCTMGPKQGVDDSRSGIIYYYDSSNYTGWNPGGKSIYNNSWHHWVITYNGITGDIKQYVDGILNGVGNLTNLYHLQSFRYFYVGSAWDPGYGGHDGYIDDVRVYATTLSETDIFELYQTRASIDNAGNLFTPQVVEDIEPTVNLVSNNSFESGSYSGWVISNATTGTCSVDSVGYDGTYSLKATVSNGGDQYQHVGYNFGYDITGKSFTVSAYVKTVATTSNIKCATYWQNSAGSWIFSNNVWSTEVITGTCDWTRISATGIAPTGAYQALILIAPAVKDGNGSYWIDAVQIEEIDHVTPFINGIRLQSENLPSTFVYKEAVQENGIVQADSFSEVGITSGLTLYYPFDKDVNDYSGNNYHGTSYNTSLVPGIKNQAYSFNGTTSYIASTFAFPISYSIGCWFKHNGWAFNYENHLIASNDSWAVGRYRLYYKSTDVRFDLYDQFASYNTTDHLDGNWHHLFATFYNGTLKLYFDSNLVSTNSSVTRVISTSSMSIGRLYVNSSDIRYHVGSIDEVRIYNRALLAEEVAILYETTSPTSSSAKITKDTIYMRNEIKEVY